MADNDVKVRIALSGVGFGSRVQIPGFLKIPGVEIAGVSSEGRYARVEQVARDFNTVACRSYDELLALPNLDAVSIVSPPYLHHQQTMAALSAGKHVLCEKPMAMDVREAKEMTEACKQRGLVGMIDHEFRYVPARAYTQELIAGGWLGKLYQANFVALGGSAADPQNRPYGWLFQKATGGGFLGALGSHYIDALHFWLGNIAAVSAHIGTAVKQRPEPNGGPMQTVDADDHFTLLCRLAGGGEAMINVSVVARFGGGERIELYGSQGTLVIDGEGRLYGGKAGEERLQLLNIPARYTGGISSDDPRLRPFVTLATDFVNAIRAVKKGQPAPTVSPSFADGVRVQQVLDAARQADEQNCWVSLPPK